MTLSALPTLLTTRRLQSFVGETRLQLDQTRVEAVTGFAFDRAEKVGGDIGHLRKLEKLLADNDQRIQSIAQFRGDASIVQISVGQTRETLSALQFDLDGALSLKNEEGVKAAGVAARSELEALWGRLNATHAGRYLFSGAKTDTAPLADLDTMLADVQALIAGGSPTTVETALNTYFDDPTGGFHTTIYQGSTTADAPDREVDQSRRMGITLKAIDEPVRDAIRSLAVIALSNDAITNNSQRDAVMAQAAIKAGDAAVALTLEQTTLGALEGEAERLEARHQGAAQVLETQIRELISIDQYEAASRMNELETQLEASYLTTSRIQQLSFVNYMR